MRLKVSPRNMWIVASRDLSRFWRYKHWLAGQVAMNLADILIFGLIFRGIVNPALIPDYVKFITPGILALSIFISAFSIGREVGVELRREVTHYLVSLPISRADLIFGRILGGVLRALIYQAGFLVFALLILPKHPGLVDWLLIFYTTLLLSFTMSSISISLSTSTRDFNMQATLRSVTYYIMFFVSNVFYPETVIAIRLGPAAPLVKYSPLTMATAIYRSAFGVETGVDIAFNVIGLLGWTTLISLLAYKLYSRNLGR